MVHLDRMLISAHAMDAYCLFYPSSGKEHVYQAILYGELADPADVWMLLRRRGQPSPLDTFVVHPERTGFFVLERSDYDETGWYVRTFLRFYSLAQHQAACIRWPTVQPVSAEASWAGDSDPRSPIERVIGGRVDKINGRAWPGGRPALDAAIAAGRYHLVAGRYARDLIADLPDGSFVVVETDDRGRRIATWSRRQ